MNAATQTFLDLQPTLKKTVRAFRSRYGGDQDDLESIGHDLFMAMYPNHDTQRSCIIPRYRKKLWFMMLDHTRTRLKQCAKHAPVDPDAVSRSDIPSSFDLTAFVESLPERCRKIIDLILNPPRDIRLATLASFHDQPTRSILKEYLRGTGWDGETIRTCFEIIRDALP